MSGGATGATGATGVPVTIGFRIGREVPDVLERLEVPGGRIVRIAVADLRAVPDPIAAPAATVVEVRSALPETGTGTSPRAGIQGGSGCRNRRSRRT